MRKMGLNEIREKYLAYFESKGHMRLSSFPLVPRNDPSILLINAGMTPFKPYFTGAQTPPAPRVTTCQKCIRTPDIERVGKTSRHGTFFEMLGNFSFGDYFKKEAIAFAWEFVTQVLEMPIDRLYASVYLEDDEAYDIWKNDIGLPAERIVRLGKEDNFWEHGTGPCGPSSEIFFDRGADKGCGQPDCKVGCDCDRFVEFWNLVFTQFNREEDGSYTPLEKRNIDTGGGLERFACLMQDVDNLFEVDTIRAILDHVCAIASARYGENQETDIAIRVVTDHIRSTVFMISDGILPSNEGRGYVLRRLLRRAARFGRLLGIEGTFLHKIVDTVVRESGEAYPELIRKRETFQTVIRIEEERFAETIQAGSAVLERLLDETRAAGSDILDGKDAFLLHDTYGFPLDLTREIAEEQGIGIDEAGFADAMRRQKERARAALRAKTASAWEGPDGLDAFGDLPPTIFTGYDRLEEVATVLLLVRTSGDNDDKTIVEEANVGDHVLVVTDRSPFYAEAGGQTGDRGEISGDGTTVTVSDTRKTGAGIYLHEGKIETGKIRQGDEVQLSVDRARRLATARNHTATHLLHKALRIVLGEHVAQAGSAVSPDRLRFDFSHYQPLTPAERSEVERLVNAAILEDLAVETDLMTLDEARQSGAMALFDDKYGDHVRVVRVGGYSRELCGGTHLRSSSQACLFRMLSEGGVASGVRRIEAVTGQAAFDEVRADADILAASLAALKVPAQELPRRIETLLTEHKSLEKKLAEQAVASSVSAADGLVSGAQTCGSFRTVSARVEAPDADTLRRMADHVRDRIGEGVVFLAAATGGKVLFVAMATPDAVRAGVSAGDLVREAARATGGGGGGRPDMAQAGGRDASRLDEVIRETADRIQRALTD
ncbi:MAG: alanine--tRNA ligase [Clostridiaceae bacterium]|nr:alanine--tRNA ligase [Clostridiaceae bacterium]